MKIEVYSPTIKRKEMDAVLTAMVEDKIGPGEQAKFLIQTAREKLKFDYCLALRSPAFALFFALKSLNLEKGQGVVISALSPLYYQQVLDDLGLIAVYCDVLPSTCVMSRETIEKALESKPEGLDIRAIILHHTLGFLCDALVIAELGIPIIEDCSQSYGTLIQESAAVVDEQANDGSGESSAGNTGESKEKASQEGAGAVPSGCVGVFTILGLEERDMLTSGGGALIYAGSRRSSRLRDSSVLRNLAELPQEYGLPDMNAAMAVVQFREAAKNLTKRREIARLYTQSALRTRHKRFVQNDVTCQKTGGKSAEDDSPQALPVEYNNYAFPLVLETGLKDVKAYGRRKDIAVESAFETTLVGSGQVLPEQCPEAYSLSLRTVLFPLYPRLRFPDAEKISKLIQTLP